MEFLGIDIGGTKCAVVRGDEKGNILAKERFDTADVKSTLQAVFDAAARLKGDSRAVGISCGSPLDEEAGLILSPPNLPGWDRVEIVRMAQEKLGIPAKLCNDANACALAEWRFGAGRGSRNMIFLTFGTGFGAGLILDGRLYSGANGNAGEIGHVRLENCGPSGYGKMGSAEGFASGGGIALNGKLFAVEALQKGVKPMYCASYDELDTVTAKTIADAALAGDATALAVYEQTGEMLGRALSILIDVLNPERIVIGSIFQRSGQLMRGAMERVIARETLTAAREVCRVVPAELGDELGDCAALALAVDCYESWDGR